MGDAAGALKTLAPQSGEESICGHSVTTAGNRARH